MKIRLNNPEGKPLVEVTVGEQSLPPVVQFRPEGGHKQEYFLDWDRAFDDEGHLRKCPSCGCEAMYYIKTFPGMNVFIFVLVVTLVFFAFYQFNHEEQVVPIAAIVGAAVLANLFLAWYSPRRLVCYRCGRAYYGVKISPRMGEWDPVVQEKNQKG